MSYSILENEIRKIASGNLYQDMSKLRRFASVGVYKFNTDKIERRFIDEYEAREIRQHPSNRKIR